MPVIDQLLEQHLVDCKSPEDLWRTRPVTRADQKLSERAIEAELGHHHGYAKHGRTDIHSGCSCNGPAFFLRRLVVSVCTLLRFRCMGTDIIGYSSAELIGHLLFDSVEL